MAATSNRKAITIVEKDKTHISEGPLPAPREDEIQIKIAAVALNPTDWKHIAYLPAPGAIVGNDYAGTVLAVGSDVEKAGTYKKGDRVAGVTHGSCALDHNMGAFTDTAIGIADVSIPVPEKLSFEDVAPLGISISTVAQSLYQSLQLPIPGEGKPLDGTPLLIYGGSTATGLWAIQFAKLSGAKVAVTCSGKNFELCKKFGADACFDYSKGEECSKQIREYFDSKLKLVMDCISTPDSIAICAAAIGDGQSNESEQGKWSGLLPPPKRDDLPRNKAVEYTSTLMYSVFGRPFKFAGHENPAKPEDRELAKKIWKLTGKLLEEGKLKPIPITVNDGGSGLDGVLKGMEKLKSGQVSGTKLVYKL